MSALISHSTNKNRNNCCQRHVMRSKCNPGIVPLMFNALDVTGRNIIAKDNFVSLLQQAVAKMRTYKSAFPATRERCTWQISCQLMGSNFNIGAVRSKVSKQAVQQGFTMFVANPAWGCPSDARHSLTLLARLLSALLCTSSTIRRAHLELTGLDTKVHHGLGANEIHLCGVSDAPPERCVNDGGKV